MGIQYSKKKMIKKIRSLGRDELVKGSLILFIMINLFNFLNYIFHFSMARLLGPSEYGVLAVLMSIVYIFTIPSEAIQTIVTKYTSRFNIKKKYGNIKDLFYRGMKKALYLSILLLIVFLPIAFFLSGFLKIKFSLLILTGFIIFYVFFIPVVRGTLQGMKKFTELGLNMVFDSSLKVIFAIVLVWLGWRVYGAIASILIGGTAAFVFAFPFIKKITRSERKRINFKGIYSYSAPFFITMIVIVLMYSLDIIIAKRFFSPEIAGKYAVASMLGKMIFFGTYAIGKTMFPLTSETYENGKDTSILLRKSVKIISAISIVALFLYLVFPKIVISVLFGSAYTEVSGILFIVGLAYALISLINIMVLYALSIDKIKKSCFVLFIFVILQVVLLSLFNSNLTEFSLALLFSNFLMFVYSLFLIKK